MERDNATYATYCTAYDDTYKRIYEDKDAISKGYITVKTAGCLGNYAANNPPTRAIALGLGLFAA